MAYWRYSNASLFRPKKPMVLPKLTRIIARKICAMTMYRSQRPGKLYKIIASGDLERAEQWFIRWMDKVLTIPHRAELAVRVNATLDTDLDLEPLFRILMSVDSNRILAIGLFVRQRIVKGMPLEQAIGELPAEFQNKYGGKISEAFTAFPPDRPLKPGRHLAITGVSYCGSTLMERMLGGLPNTVSVGQSIDLVNRNKKGGGTVRIENFSELDFSSSAKCSQCGRECEYLTPEFRTALALNPIDWYQQLGDRFQTDLLVTADKNLPKLIRHDPLLRLDALVMFKSPIQAWYSNMNRPEARFADLPLEARMQRYIEDWRAVYQTLVNDFAPRGKVAFLDFDAFTRDPEPTLRRALEKLDIELDPEVLKKIRPSHSVGGNGPVVRNLRDDDLEVKIRARKDSLVPKEQRDWINAQEEAMKVHADLKAAAAA
jgi:hypothetical protein